MTRDLAHVPLALLHTLRHYKVLHQRVVMMQVETEDVPHVLEEHRLEIGELGNGFYTIRLRYGFMDQPNVMRALAQCRIGGLRFNLMEMSFIIGREKLRARPRRTAFWRWRDRLFILMSNNMLDATEFLPHSTEPRGRAWRPDRDSRSSASPARAVALHLVTAYVGAPGFALLRS